MMDSLLLYKILKNRTGAEISASGNPAIMSDTLKNNPMNEMKVFGWSKQKSTTGANLIDVDSMLNECLVKNDDGTYSILKTETNRFSKQFPVNLTAGTVIRFDADVIEYNGAYRLNLQISFNYQTISVGQTIILDSDVTKVSIYQDSKNDVGTYTKFKNAILSIGKAQISYEPYTGGKPSPSPEYPQEIISAEQAGVGDTGIQVKITGKNLVDIYGYSTSDISAPDDIRKVSNIYGTTISTTEKKDKLVISQKINEDAKPNSYTAGYFCIGINERLEEGKVYKVSFDMEVLSNPFGVSNIGILINGINYTTAKITEKRVATTALYEAYNKRQYVEIRNNGMSLEISNFMITEKDENTIYEPYYEPQSLSISTPTGLPAIPVDSDGNYTDANGQQWVADYVDLKRGKYVQNINTCMIDSSTNVFRIGREGIYWNLPENSLPGILKGIGINSKYPIFPSKYFERRRFNANTAYSMLYTDGDNMKGLFNSIEELNTFCKERYDAGDPVEFYYVIEPIERDLTPEEIQAYKNLVTYAGTTIVENDAECYMEVSAGGGDALRAKKLALLLGD